MYEKSCLFVIASDGANSQSGVFFYQCFIHSLILTDDDTQQPLPVRLLINSRFKFKKVLASLISEYNSVVASESEITRNKIFTDHYKKLLGHLTLRNVFH